MQYRRLLAIIFLAAVIIFAFWWFAGRRTSDKGEYVIGAILPITGEAKAYGEWMTNGMRLAADHVNERRGYLDKTLKVEIADSESTAEGGERAFKRLMATRHPDAIVTTVTPVSKALIPLADREGIVLFTSATAPGLVDESKWAFRNASNIGDEVRVILEFAARELKIKRIALLYNNNAVGQWLAKNMEEAAGKNGIEISTMASYEKGETDFHAQIEKIRNVSADAVYLYGYNELGLIAKQIRELGLNLQLLGGLDMELPEFVEIGRNAVEGAIYTKSEFSPKSAEDQRFVRDYRRRHGSEPEVYAAVHYDTVGILARALREAGHDRERMRREILSLQNYPGVSGLTSFGSSRDARKPIVIKTIRGGEHLEISRP